MKNDNTWLMDLAKEIVNAHGKNHFDDFKSIGIKNGDTSALISHVYETLKSRETKICRCTTALKSTNFGVCFAYHKETNTIAVFHPSKKNFPHTVYCPNDKEGRFEKKVENIKKDQNGRAPQIKNGIYEVLPQIKKQTDQKIEHKEKKSVIEKELTHRKIQQHEIEGKEKKSQKQQNSREVSIAVFMERQKVKEATNICDASQVKVALKKSISDNSVSKINGVDRQRLLEKYQRYEKQARNQGATVKASETVATNRMYSVMARYEQMQDRAAAFKDATKFHAEPHMKRVTSLQNQVIADRKQNAAVTGRQYKGPEPKSEPHKKAYENYHATQIRLSGALEKNRQDGHLSDKDYDRKKQDISELLATKYKSELGQFEKSHHRAGSTSHSHDYSMAATHNSSGSASSGECQSTTYSDSYSQGQSHSGHSQSHDTSRSYS